MKFRIAAFVLIHFVPLVGTALAEQATGSGQQILDHGSFKDQLVHRAMCPNNRCTMSVWQR